MSGVESAVWEWDARELRILDQGMAEAHVRAGEHARCGRGCFGCCLGPFPITALDAHRLRRGLEILREADAERARRLAGRAVEAWSVLEPVFPGDPAAGILDEDSAEAVLYEHRPVACRTYGLAVRHGGVDLEPCRLNYAGLSRKAWEALRVTLGPPVPPPSPLPPGLTVVAAALIGLTPASSAGLPSET